MQGQCAGQDATLEVCDYANPANQSINLFPLLGPDAVPGGFWIDPLQTGALNVFTGELNLWNFHFTGEYAFTYVANNAPGCIDRTATVTVTVGGFSGVTSPNGSACGDDAHVNLFQYFIGMDPYPQQNGVWTSPDVPIIDDKFFNAQQAGQGTYSFTYTTPAIGNCPEMASTAIVTVYRPPYAGPPLTEIYICEADDLSQYTNLNLADLIDGEDTNGLWAEAGTGQIDNPFDSFIDLQQLYANFNVGTYTFNYTVFPAHPVCDKKTAVIKIHIENRIDLTGGSLTFDPICNGDLVGLPIHATITQGPDPVPWGEDYEIDYHIEGPGISETRTQEVAFVNGECHFDIAPTGFGPVGLYQITVTDIRDMASHQSCESIAGIQGTLAINPLPNIDAAVITIPTVCQGSDGIVQFSAMDLADGNYELTYSIFASNKLLDQHVVLHVVNGATSLIIPAVSIPNTGNSTFFISHIKNLKTGCEAELDIFKTFVIYPLPFVDNITLESQNGCLSVGAAVTVTDLGTMTAVKVTYNLSGANTATAQEATFTSVLGNGTFNIPPSLLPNSGATTVTVTLVQDLVTGCSSPTNVSDEFIMNILPDVTTLTASVNDVCQGALPTVSLAGLGNQPNLKLNYALSGANVSPVQSINLSGAEATVFELPAALLPNTGTTILTLVSITNTQTGCIAPLDLPLPFKVNPVPPVVAFSAVIQSVCAGQPAFVLLSNLGTVGAMEVTYSLSGANTLTDQTTNLVIVDGAAVLTLPSTVISNAGNTTFTISHAQYPDTGCQAVANFTKNFTINPLPEVSNLTVTAGDVCVGNVVPVTIGGFSNTNAVRVSYQLSGANAGAVQELQLVPSGGAVQFSIPVAQVGNVGETLLTVIKLVNPQTGCESSTSASATFHVNAIPAAPLANAQTFCIEQQATVSSLLPSGDQYIWFASGAAVDPLAPDVLLANGNYFVSEASNAGCFSPRTAVAVSIITLPPPSLNPDGQLFCGADKPTIADLDNRVSATESVLWFDAVQNGNLLPADQLLVEGTTYYGVQQSVQGCVSQEVLPVLVSLTKCDSDPSVYDFFIPDGFSPNGDTVNDTFRIPDIEFLFPEYSYEIYNRYGNLLFRGNINKPAWDGTDTMAGNGSIVPNGVYFYIVQFNKAGAAPRQGRLYLNR